MIPTSIDGTDITGATIDGTDVTEITVDGAAVGSFALVVTGNFDLMTSSGTLPAYPDVGDTFSIFQTGQDTTFHPVYIDGNNNIQLSVNNPEGFVNIKVKKNGSTIAQNTPSISVSGYIETIGTLNQNSFDYEIKDLSGNLLDSGSVSHSLNFAGTNQIAFNGRTGSQYDHLRLI